MSATRSDPRLPARMRDHELEAELRESPDLHKLAQVFIGLAMNRARADHTPAAVQGREVESEPQDAND
ncbi:hypothetical protein BAURA86_00877 [Brevibacterium aurantiacum]|uniref:Uncharacterized protein n=1 Tax=Brevibacterium aurantiacum TaxID=273384 RepID=A0A2H1IR93_BREAU|nr:hypothetical protein [Brevibacterium aurantiacum]SMX77620.1 hypothetical protein BAURA86_00877 [Brevibacterium aurantiacum]